MEQSNRGIYAVVCAVFKTRSNVYMTALKVQVQVGIELHTPNISEALARDYAGVM